MLTMFNEEETLATFDDCRMEAGTDINKVMELIVPKIYEIQGHVMQKYGFQPTDEGTSESKYEINIHLNLI